MKRKVKNVLLCVLVVVFICASGYLLYMSFDENVPEYSYGDYKVRITDNVYCPAAKIGCAEIEIEDSSKGFLKLLHTSNDMFYNKDNMIIDDDYMLQAGGHYKCKAYETEVKDRTQYLKVYYVNTGKDKKADSFRIEIVETKGKKIRLRIPAKPDIDEEYGKYVCEGQEIYVTSKGVMFDVEGTDQYDEPNMTAVTMNIEWKDKNGAITLKNNVEAGIVNGREIMKSKLKWIEEDQRFYAVELEKWKEIEKVVVGGNNFKKE